MKQHSLPGLSRLLIFGTLFVASCNLLHAAGGLSGRVFNRATNTILENVRITIEGTALEAHSDGNGYFILSGIPAGEQKLNAAFTEFKSQKIAVQIIDGKDTELEIYMSQTDDSGEDVVRLEKYTVMAERLSAEAAALNEQKMAAILKNVVAFEEFGEMGEGNPGEFLKFVPGVSMTMSPSTAATAAIRGLPVNGTLVMMEGNQVASALGDRAFELNGADTANISYVEVTKTPTPDMPANSIGGAINIIGKSGFRSKKPQLIYKVFFTGNYLDTPSNFEAAPFRKREAPSRAFETQSVNPSFDLSYFHPVNRSLAFTVTTNYSKRLESMNYNYKYWHYPREQYYYIQHSVVDRMMERALFAISLDWKPSRFSTFRATAQYSMDDSTVVFASAVASSNSPENGTLDHLESEIADGKLTWGVNPGIYHRTNQLYRISYKFDNNKWKIESDISASHSTRKSDDEAEGYPGVVTAAITGLYLNVSGISQVFDGYAPYVTVSKSKDGPYETAYDPSDASITNANFLATDNANRINTFRLNASRTLEFKIPTAIKMGISFMENNLDLRSPLNAYVPAAGKSVTVESIDAIDWDYSKQTQMLYPDGSRVDALWIDIDKVFGVMKDTDYFTRNDASSYLTTVSSSRELNEKISAAFFRVDNRFLEDRLRLAWGVRYEYTEDKGKGLLDDITKTYERDADGNIIYTGSGSSRKPVVIPNLTTYENYQLRYTERGATGGKSYGEFFPSINANFELTRSIILRSAYARTISRPPMSTITPSISISAPYADPDDPDLSRYTITTKDPALKPWTADNYDFSVEIYSIKDITASVGVFRKDIKDFFTVVSANSTPELMEYYGIPAEFENSTFRVYQNIGSGSVTGFEWSYRQNLKFMPDWARGLQIYANGTHLRLSGERGDDFGGFNPRIINYGMGLTRPKVIARVNVSMRGRSYNGMEAANSKSRPGGARLYITEQTIVDFNFKYVINKHYSVYLVVKNLFCSDRVWERVSVSGSADTPAEAVRHRIDRTGAAITLGLSGVF